jgi:hypothetical protein
MLLRTVQRQVYLYHQYVLHSEHYKGHRPLNAGWLHVFAACVVYMACTTAKQYLHSVSALK